MMRNSPKAKVAVVSKHCGSFKPGILSWVVTQVESAGFEVKNINVLGIQGHRICGSGSNSLPGAKAADQHRHLPPSYRPIPAHRASMPCVFSQGTPHSADAAFVPIKHSTPVYASRYHSGLYSMPSRPVTEPIPGPLPNPNFSFGDSSASASPLAPSSSTSESSEQLVAVLNSYAFPPVTDTDQEEEASPNVLYGSFATRFSSIASLADSESSVTSPSILPQEGRSCH